MDICEILLKGVVTLLVAIVSAKIGIQIYFKQKEYELVKSRYLDGSVDVISSEVEHGLGVLNHNWARCINIVRAFRDQKDNFEISELEKGFLEFDSSQFQTIPHHRLQNLVGNQIFWDVFQLSLSFVNSSNSVITKEITDSIRIKLTDESVETPIEEVTDYAIKTLKQINADSRKYSLLTHNLQIVADILEREKLEFKRIEVFHEKKEIEEAIHNLQKTFEKELNTKA